MKYSIITELLYNALKFFRNFNALYDMLEDINKVINEIRLKNTTNKSAIEFYTKRNYVIRGNVCFPDRAYPFYRMEKQIVS